ncbi:MAG TPA: hypothetical protein VJT08_08980 [Terriglobales bacterium]|nr:hypothetical protein [Terriglobales bacterium]
MIRTWDVFVVVELLVIESLVNMPADSPANNTHGPRLRVMDALPGSQSSVQLHERVLYQIFRQIVISERPGRISHKLHVAAIKERRHQFGRLSLVHASSPAAQKQLIM